MSRGLAATAAAVLLPAALASAAQAATKTVDMGTPPSAGKSFEPTRADVNAFFPRTITVAAGDKVAFRPVGFHNVDMPKKGGKQVGLTQPFAPIAGAVDAAGAPFWFNGQPGLGFAAPLVQPQYGKTVSYTGAKDVNSGLPLAPKPKPFTVKFTKAGSYTYFCDLHPGMKGTVKVKAKGARVPTAAADRKTVKAQVAAALKVAKALAATPPSLAPNTVDVGVAGKGGVERFVFAPASLTVAPGTTVKFQMAPGSRDVHTATTGPGDPENAPTSFLGTLAAAFEKPVFEPAAAVYPSDTPGTTAGLTPTSHGNGFWSSGVLDRGSASPLPADSSVRFDAAGTYEFYCLIHPFMHGTVVVQ